MTQLASARDQGCSCAIDGLVALAAADQSPSGLDPLSAFGIFAGVPAVIVAIVVVAVYAGRWKLLLRQRRDGIPRTRAGELPPLTQPVLGIPGPVEQPQPRQCSTGREANPDGHMSGNDPADDDAGG